MMQTNLIALTLSAILALGGLYNAASQGDPEWATASLPSPDGNIRVLTKEVSTIVPDARNKSTAIQTRIVYAPTNQIVWIGTTDYQVVLMSARLIGLKTGASANGGFLLLRVATNRLDAGNLKAHGFASALATYLKTIRPTEIAWAPRDQRLPLCDYVGRRPLMDLKRADVGMPPEITQVRFQESNLVVSMKSPVGKEIVMTLDNHLDPLLATAEGTTTFERGKKHLPSFVDELRAAEPTSESSAQKTTVIRSKAVSSPQQIRFRSKDGPTNEIRCFLREELHSIPQPGTGNSPHSSTRTKIALIDEGPAQRERWSYWPPNFPLAYDFQIGSGPAGTIIAFAKNYSIGILEAVDGETRSLSDPQPTPHFIDLLHMMGEDAFAPEEGRVTNALTRNLRVVRVAWRDGWVITIRGKGGKTFDLIGAGTHWQLGVNEPGS